MPDLTTFYLLTNLAVVDDGKDGDKGLVAVRLVGPHLGRADRVSSEEDLHTDKLGSGAAPAGPRGRDDESLPPLLL